jgi:hypothetical protein
MSKFLFWRIKMSYQTNVIRKHKDSGREMVMDIAPKKVKTYLTLPGEECTDLKLALGKKIIDRTTKVIVIEKVPKIADIIRKFLKKNFDNFYLHVGSIQKFELSKVVKNEEIDFVFLDFCGCITHHISYWINKHYQYFSINCPIAVTTTYNVRRQEFIKFSKKWMKKSHKRIIKNQTNDCEFRHTSNLNHVFTPNNVKGYGIHSDTDIINTYLFLLTYSFDFQCELKSIFSYRDTNKDMALIIFKLKEDQKMLDTYWNQGDKMENLIEAYDKITSCSNRAIVKKRNKKSKVNKNSKEKFQEFKIKLINNGIKNNGVIRVKSATMAWITMYSKMFGKDVGKVKDGIKDVVSIKTGKKATFYIIPNKKTVSQN